MKLTKEPPDSDITKLGKKSIKELKIAEKTHTKYKEENKHSIEKFTTSYELSKKLCEIGVPQTGYCIYRTTNVGYVAFNIKGDLTPIDTDVDSFTAAELGIYLPEYLTINDYNLWLYMSIDKIEYSTTNYTPNMEYIKFTNDTEANLRAKMIINLIENKYINLI